VHEIDTPRGIKFGLHSWSALIEALLGRSVVQSLSWSGVERIAWFPRFGGHPDLTFQECPMPKLGPRTPIRYRDEFKATAVRLRELPGVRVRDVAVSLYNPLRGLLR
jgi:hypothetical protein